MVSSYITRYRKERGIGVPTKIQLIKRKASRQFYVNFPAALAKAMEFVKGEIVEWVVKDSHTLILRRLRSPKDQKQGERHGR